VAGLLLNITPGADTLYILGRSAAQGVRAGAVAALGIGAGCLVHILAATLGLSAIIATSATAFAILKLAGAAYLVWLGISLLRSAGHTGEKARVFGQDTMRKVFLQGFMTNALNPKVAIFFLAFLPQFIAVDAPDKAVSMLVLGLIFDLNGTLWNLLLAYGGSSLARRIGHLPWVARLSRQLAGGLFLFLGYKLAISRS